MLYHATERGELPFRDTGGRHVFDDGTSIFEWGETYISRSALKKWCAAKGFCPKCLFPEERHESSDKDQRAKGDIKLPWNVKREKDDWVPAIKEAGQTLLEELGRIPNSAQVWIRLIENPPHGYGIKRDGDILTIPTAPPLSRKEFETRWRNYTEVEDKDA
ncbi:hypothetical protein [Methylococcus capsulatus]|uniref:hypothetical protein n=1 Tax=Methylococcus capsulatus TaxID=414 RepID=UPI002FDB8C00